MIGFHFDHLGNSDMRCELATPTRPYVLYQWDGSAWSPHSSSQWTPLTLQEAIASWQNLGDGWAIFPYDPNIFVQDVLGLEPQPVLTAA